jgi:hypothetical protein
VAPVLNRTNRKDNGRLQPRMVEEGCEYAARPKTKKGR